jgi:acetamidase/formamidase
VKRVTRDQTSLFFDRAADPVVTVRSGERIIIETADSLCGVVKAQVPRGWRIDEVIDELGGACPVSGPIWVEGAQPGDALAITFHRIDPAPLQGDAWTGVFTGFGALSHEAYGLQEPLASTTTLVPYSEGVAHFPARGRSIPIPMRPFLGTVGVAPRFERRMSFSQSIEYAGDMDLPQVTVGATLVLPVHAPGALLSLGDAHAAQGDGEITGAAIEIEAEVELTCEVLSPDEAAFVELPQINTPGWIGSVACLQGTDLTNCARAAYRDLVLRLVHHYGFTQAEAYQLLGQVGRLQVGNMIDPFYSALAMVDREYLH